MNSRSRLRVFVRPDSGDHVDGERADGDRTPDAGQRRKWSWRGPRTLAGQVFALEFVLVLLLVVATVAVLVSQTRRQVTRSAYDRSLSVAETFAYAPGTLAAMRSADPSAVLQPAAEQVYRRAEVAYVVAFAPDGTRWSHPDPSLIGGRVSGNYAPALTGEPFQETFDSTLFGRAVDTTVAVTGPDGQVVGLVSVGITTRTVNNMVGEHLPPLFGVAAGALLLAAIGSAWVSRRLRAQTRGLEPAEMTHMYEHHDAVLHAVHEGVVIVAGGRVELANDEARRLLDLPPGGEPEVARLGLPPDMDELLVSGRASTDEIHRVGDRLLAVSQRAVERNGRTQGSVATLRDTTELRALAGRADVADRRLELLYDAGIRLGTNLDIGRTAQELADVAVPRFADYVTVDLYEPVLGGGDPEDRARQDRARLARAGFAGIRDDHAFTAPGSAVHIPPEGALATAAATGHAVVADLFPDGNVRSGQDTYPSEDARRIARSGVRSLVAAPLHARDTVLGVVGFWRSESEPFGPEDLAVAEELALRAAVCIDNARRYTREHATAVTLQRYLLPHDLPHTSTLDIAHRYLPARGRVGGDWFDVIPLSGTRVALVVGDVVGHGLHAAATMGRLRTAVHNFSALDLAPDELLARLDELVDRIDAEGGNDTVLGASCLYAVHNPVTGTIVIASAGHPGPALIDPDGTVSYPDVPVSPLLGAGGNLPVETVELRLPDEATLVLFTDGLIVRRDRDIDTGLAELRAVLARPGMEPERICRAVFDAMVPAVPYDDIALLVARARRLDPDRVLERAVPRDPAAVSEVRTEASRQLEHWGLDHLAYTTELIVSELVTNAVRYGLEPIVLRLILDDTGLVCEVSDGSSTAPHLRRAAEADEGGRGLYLVARFCERWGTRYSARGKTIWTRQPLRDTGAAEAALSEALLGDWDDPDL